MKKETPMPPTRKSMVDTLLIWYCTEQLVEMTDKEVSELYQERMGQDTE